MSASLSFVNGAKRQFLGKFSSVTNKPRFQNIASSIRTFSSSSSSGEIVADIPSSNPIILPDGSVLNTTLTTSFSRIADPWDGEKEAKYAAPVKVPEELWKNSGFPRILFQDPWNAPDYHEVRKKHATLIHEYLKGQSEPVTAQAILDGVNKKYGPIIGTADYVTSLMENLLYNKMAYEVTHTFSSVRKAKLSKLPRLFGANKFQQVFRGSPEEQAKRYNVVRAKCIKVAFTRLRTSKTPHVFRRRVDDFSIFQYEKVNDLLNKM